MYGFALLGRHDGALRCRRKQGGPAGMGGHAGSYCQGIGRSLSMLYRIHDSIDAVPSDRDCS
jgi:hypothetical protein